MEETDYQMNGILSAWQNPSVLRNNTYNQAPQLQVITRQDIFKPNLNSLNLMKFLSTVIMMH